MTEVKLSLLLKKMDELGISRNSYLYGTFLDYCGLPNKRSLFDKGTGLIRANFKNRKGYVMRYEPAVLSLLERMNIKYLIFRVGKDAVDSRIMITSKIDVDIKEI